MDILRVLSQTIIANVKCVVSYVFLPATQPLLSIYHSLLHSLLTKTYVIFISIERSTAATIGLSLQWFDLTLHLFSEKFVGYKSGWSDHRRSHGKI